MRKRQSAETNMPSPEKHSNTISVPAQQFMVPLMFHSAPTASLSRRLPAHDCLADLVIDIESSGDSPCPTRSACSGISCDSAGSGGSHSDGFSSTAS